MTQKVNPGDYYYANLGRPWEPCGKYGFIHGGGGKWYHHGMHKPQVGDKIWVYYPTNPRKGWDNSGYIGLAQVTEPMTSIRAFQVMDNGVRKDVLAVLAVLTPNEANGYRQRASNGDLCEYFIGVKWLNQNPNPGNLFHASKKAGYYSDRHTVCKPKHQNADWIQTVHALVAHFGVS